MLSINLIGAFRLVDSDGNEICLSGRKSCALLAMLATAPGHTRSRAWLMDHLWSDRSPEQASGSLRQALREIRSALGASRELLQTRQSMIRLAASQVWIDVEDDSHLRQLASEVDEDFEFLSNIDIADREFENWVRDKRLHYSDLMARFRDAQAHNDTSTPVDAPGPALLRGREFGSDQKRAVFSEVLSDLVCKSLSDAGTVRILDSAYGQRLSNGEADHVIRLDAKAFEFERHLGAGLTLTRLNNHQVVLNATRTVGNQAQLSLELTEVLQLINEAVDVSISEFLRMYPTADQRKSAASLCFHGVNELFQLRFDTLEQTDRLFEEAFEMDPRAVYLAWRAYLRTFILGERPDIPRDATIDEMKEFMYRALEMEPNNSLVLSLSAFIFSMWLLDHETGLSLARKSVEINPANPLGVAYLGIIHSHLGDYGEGHRLTHRAAQISGVGPYRHTVAYAALSAAAYAGHHQAAIRIGEALTRTAPNFGAAQRILSLLYRKTGQFEKSDLVVERLRKSEPEFSFDLMKESFYRSAIIRRTQLMEKV